MSRARLPLPPGPPGLPFIGNAHQIRGSDRWKTFQRWHKQYGPVICVKNGLKPMIVLGDYKTARDLLDKRGDIYSSRPDMVVPYWLSKGFNTTTLPYGGKWRNHHRVQAGLLNTRMAQKYQLLQDIESRQVMHEMLDTNNFIPVFHRFSSSLIFTLAYGRRLSTCDSEEIHQADRMLEDFVYACHRFGFLENFPFLNYLPPWLATWKKWGDEYHQRAMEFFESKFKEGQAKSSWNWTKQAKKINQSTKEPLVADPAELTFVVGLLHEAASATTDKALQFFVMACVLHPDAARRAQKELDEVVGADRLPDFEDMPNLPYTKAFINEIQRWRPLILEGVAHASTKDDEYMGYRIPRGAVVTANHWSLDMDEEVFPEPEEFKPERWLNNPNLPQSTFGFGRRVCTGQNVARNSVFIIGARILWGYDISHAYEEDGTRIEIDSWSMTQNISTNPTPFTPCFRVRGPQQKITIDSAWADAEKDPDSILSKLGI
ncbi:hypothetical protein FQN49_004189 [Arthroderma sp. PD_2]|nr:hypothetical protein FQN49_004189 [Arthroderma sp. PD_2]